MTASAKLRPLLTYVHAHLDEDLGLATLSRRAGLSSTHLHRVFKSSLGETPRDHVERLRVELAAFRLLIHDATHLRIALDSGFRNQETFIRAFRRRFGVPPSEYRAFVRSPAHALPPRRKAPGSPQPFELSATRVVRLRSMNLAFIRHVGPYETVPDTLFDELRDWALDRSLSDPPVWMGIGHDAPGATRPEHLRFDAALVVLEPFESDGRICHQRFEGGEFAATTHSGPLDTLPLAYASIFPRALTLSGYRLIGLPAVEIYRGSTTSHGLRPDQTDIYLPVSREA